MSTDLQRSFRVFGQVFVSSLHSAGKTKRIFMTVFDLNISKKKLYEISANFLQTFCFPCEKVWKICTHKKSTNLQHNRHFTSSVKGPVLTVCISPICTVILRRRL